ncbi:hypothetical protein [Bacillus horti]|uniref:Uncharacterized protein n=1 Tax=Caldalkalibacillus horti TaxID=77523 RepID=A0ABT9W3P8_9BACI|nr:hypothetical protein [Bacillus horti]MDQ0167872.1 hypothetical protein [Bacillus horti]
MCRWTIACFLKLVGWIVGLTGSGSALTAIFLFRHGGGAVYHYFANQPSIFYSYAIIFLVGGMMTGTLLICIGALVQGHSQTSALLYSLDSEFDIESKLDFITHRES